MKKLIILFCFLLFPVMILFYTSCQKSFKAEIPAYLHIEKIDLTVSAPAIQGTSSHKITDAWVFADDDLLGVYELPATFPVLKSGTHSLKILAGIKDNGISASRVQYPFYEFYGDKSFTFYPDSIIGIDPEVSYYSSVKFPWLEDFENPGITIDSVFPSLVKVKATNDVSQVYEGGYSGYVALDAGNYLFKGHSNSAFDLPKGGSAVYLELNYKTTVNLDVIVISNNPVTADQDFVLRIAPTNKSGIAEWNKIYVNLSPQVSANSSASNYKIAFYANISNDGITSGEIFLDNIKLIHL